MIRSTDVLVLAYTKLRARKIRTSVTVAIAGLLFGFLVLIVIVAQGVLDSATRFSSEGLNSRYIIDVARTDNKVFNIYDNLTNPDVVRRVEAEHAAHVAKKQAAAKKYGIDYDARNEDPSPIVIDQETKEKIVSDKYLDSSSVAAVAEALEAEQYKPFDVSAYIDPYKTAKIIGEHRVLHQFENTLRFMKDGKEASLSSSSEVDRSMSPGDDDNKSLTVLDSSVAEPFISNRTYDPASGEIPAIIPYSDAEKLLGLKKLESSVSTQQQLDRIQEVRRRVGEITAKFCYRNSASQALVTQAINQQKEIVDNRNNPDYVKPTLLYAVPSSADCGAVVVQSDSRTSIEKKQAGNQKNYEKEIGTYIGEPEQHKVIVRGVGVSSDLGFEGEVSFSVAQIIKGIFSSSLGYQTWNIPSALLAKVPESSRPAAVFEPSSDTKTQFSIEAYLVEFTDKAEARELLSKAGFFGANNGSVYAAPFGSSSLVVDEMRSWFETALLWIVGVVSLVAIIILSGMIGRTIADGRKESAVFRAIGARRGDIARIYSTYTLLLSLRIVLFAAFFGIVSALALNMMLWHDATIGAQLAFGASNPKLEFHFIGFGSWYLPVIVAVIIGVGLLAMVIPLLRNSRRSPINDMRDDG